MTKFLRSFAQAAVSVCMLALSVPSQAIPISADSPTYNFSWSVNSDAGALSGTGSMLLSGFNTGTLSLLITLNNTSSLVSNRLTSFGFGIDPNATGVAFTDTADGGMIAASMSAIPGLANIEVCAFGGPNNCRGGGNGGIRGGSSDTFTVGLFGTWGSSVNIYPLGFKYQTGLGSFEFTNSVPEPGLLALFLLGLVGVAALPRRRKTA